MAEIDTKELEIKKNQFLIKKKKLIEISDICYTSPEDFDEDFYYIYNRVKLSLEVMDREIYELEKYSICNHNIIIKDQWIGNDSHYDYYVDKCNNCDKVINQYKI